MPSLRNFIANVQNGPLLRKLLANHGIELAENEAQDAATTVEENIRKKLEERPPGTRTALDAAIDRILNLASEAGEVAIDQSSVLEDLDQLLSAQARSLKVFLDDSQGFKRAEAILYADEKRKTRDWAAFLAQASLDVKTSTEVLERFKIAFRKAFDTPNVHIDIFERAHHIGEEGDSPDGKPALVQITIYREDKPQTENVFEGEILTARSRRPVVEASVTYDRSSGLIECVATKKDARETITTLVATELLGCPPDFKAVKVMLYDLKILRQPHLFEHDPADMIESVRVSSMRLVPHDTAAEQILVNCTKACARNIWQVVEAHLGRGALAKTYSITQATLAIGYRGRSDRRQRSLPVTITVPHRSTLKDLTEFERLLATKYLQKWGLVAQLDVS